MRSNDKFESLTDLFRSLDLSEAQAEVYRESRARVALVGPAGAGKSSLYNCLQGWEVSAVQHDAPDIYEPAEESLGLFTLIDLPDGASDVRSLSKRRPECYPEPAEGLVEGGRTRGRPEPVHDYSFAYDDSPYGGPAYVSESWHAQDLALWSLADVDLVIFVVDGDAGLRSTDYQWFTRIRSTGCPILVALNKIDLLDGADEELTQDIRRRLAAPVVPISARDNTNVHDTLLAQILEMSPSLTVPLGRDVASCRRQVASRLIRRSAMTCGLLGAEPMPLLDVPFQLLTQMRLVMRLAAMYGRAAVNGVQTDNLGVSSGVRLSTIASGASRDVVMTLLGGLGLRYLAQQLVKLVPILGWLVSGVLSASSTWLIGWAAVTYFERAQNGVPLVSVPGGAFGWLRELKVERLKVESLDRLKGRTFNLPTFNL